MTRVFAKPITDGINRMTTYQASAMPDAKALADMRRYGFKFKMDGERVSVQKLLEYLQSGKADSKATAKVEKVEDENVSIEVDTVSEDTEAEVVEEPVEEVIEEVAEEEAPEAEDEFVEADVDPDEPVLSDEEMVNAVEAEEVEDVEEAKEETKATAGILCVETGAIFETQSQAAKAYNLHGPQVSNSIKTGKAVKGYTFKKVG